jgi:DNA-binding XRE family transcriptional regulator
MPDSDARRGHETADTIINDLIVELRAARLERRIPRDRLAASLELAEITVATWEARRFTPITVNFFRWAHELGYVVDIREASSAARIADTDEDSALGIRGAQYGLPRIVEALRKARIDAAVTQRALGSQLGVSRWTMGQWESAQRTPLLPHLVQWCEALNRRLVLALAQG